MKRVLGLLAIIVLLFTLASCQKDKVEIAIVQLGTHTSLDEINQAITSKLEDNGYNEGDYEITQHNANFSNDTANQIMQILKKRPGNGSGYPRQSEVASYPILVTSR